MPPSDETAVVATVLAGPALAAAVRAAWDAGEAILPLNPAAPAAELDGLIRTLRPTHVVDGDGRHPRRDGAPVAAAVAAIVVTSGTTGFAKGVELTRAGMEVMGRGYSAGLDAGPGDRWLACLPLHHVASLGAVARGYVTGVPWTVHNGFDLARVARSPRDEGTTIVSLVPTALARLLDDGAPLHEFRRVIVGGAPCPPALRARAEAARVAIVDAYGMTETWGGWALDGVPIPGAEPDLAPDGEILVRGTMVMRGYRFEPERTMSVLRADGWLRTGDLGAIVDGRVYVTDRAKDLVITGGVNVSPSEVERALAAHPGIRDVCVVGVADDEWGERVVAFVVPEGSPPSLDELRAFARDHLSAAKLPREVRTVTEIPRSASGKPMRRILRGET
ncbi:MAG: class I adenylate-forming enzyme family protein [Actinomycetota bacterium]